MNGEKLFTKLKIFAGYWQIRLAEHLKKKTEFRYKHWWFQFEVMSFAFMNVPAMFQGMLSQLFCCLGFASVQIDDVF